MKDMLCGVTDGTHTLSILNRVQSNHSTEFSSVNALDVVTHVISRASNRAFVGLPLCSSISLTFPNFAVAWSRLLVGRDRKYLALIKDFAPKVLSDAIVIGCLPQPVREYVFKSVSLTVLDSYNDSFRIAARMLGASSGAVFQATNYLAPLIEECTNGEHNVGAVTVSWQ